MSLMSHQALTKVRLDVDVASKFNLIAPIAEQCRHKLVSASTTLFNFDRHCIVCSVETDLKRNTSESCIDELGRHLMFSSRPLYRKYDYGTTVFSALAQGLLTGKVSTASFDTLYVTFPVLMRVLKVQ